MDRIVVAIACLLSALLVGGTGHAQNGIGAFGIHGGQKLTSLNVVKKIDDLNYEIRVPTPNPEFDSYMVRVSPVSGVCRIVGLGRTHDNDRYGTETRAAFDRLQSSLEKKYGRYKNFDFLKVGTIWKDPEDFHMSLLKKERTLTTFWDEEEKSTLPTNMRSIMLDARAVSSGPYITLAYEFGNMAYCKAARQRQDEAGL